jgi:hypothetical protein
LCLPTVETDWIRERIHNSKLDRHRQVDAQVVFS